MNRVRQIVHLLPCNSSRVLCSVPHSDSERFTCEVPYAQVDAVQQLPADLHRHCSVGDGDGLRAAFLQRVDQARLTYPPAAAVSAEETKCERLNAPSAAQQPSRGSCGIRPSLLTAPHSQTQTRHVFHEQSLQQEGQAARPNSRSQRTHSSRSTRKIKISNYGSRA